MDNAKWCRNLNFERANDIGRMRMLTKQKLEIKRNRQQQTMITSTRPQNERLLKSAYVRSSADKGLSSTDSEYNDDQNSLTSSYDITSSSVISNSIDESLVCNNRLDTRELNELLSTASISRDELDSRQISSGDISPLSTIRRNIRSAYPITQSESRVPFSKSVNNLNEHHDFNDNNISSTTINQDVSLSFSKLDQLDQITLNPLATILNSQELLQFATTIVPKHKIYQCTIIRDKKGIDRSFYPTYYMHLQAITNNEMEEITTNSIVDSIESSEAGRNRMTSEARRTTIAGPLNGTLSRQVFLLSGRRRKKSKTYLISCDPFDITRANCIAKLKSNVIGTQFNTIRVSDKKIRYDHATIIYETNVLGFKGPRKMTILLPKADDQTADPNVNLYDLWKQDRRSVIELKNKTPVWNEETQSYVLNFRGRVTQASVKNFQLVPAEDEDHSTVDSTLVSANPANSSESSHVPVPAAQTTFVGGFTVAEMAKLKQLDRCADASVAQRSITSANSGSSTVASSTASTSSASSAAQPHQVTGHSAPLALDTDISMQFGRVSEKEFTCDITWPLSLLQAFAIALSSFDSKLACE